MYDISQSYYPLVLEMRDTAVEKNESLKVYNSRVVLTEIPDTFMKVYIGGMVEIEESQFPKSGEYVVDYKTGIVTIGGNMANNTVVDVSYYGLGIIQYPAERIYSHNPSPEVSGSLQKILDRGEQAVTELNNAGDVVKRQSHASNNSFFGNNDWTRLTYGKIGDGQVNYNSTVRGVEFSGYSQVKVNVRIPIDPDSKYYVRAKVKKIVGDGKFLLGAVSLDNNYQEISTDKATSYNYFGATGTTITAGSSQIIEGSIGGYNLTTEASHLKFDPEANYFDLVIFGNYQTTADISKTVIEWLEIYRSPKTMHVQHDSSVGGTMKIYGMADMYAGLNMNNKDITRIKQLVGEYGTIAQSTDEWLRINADVSHTFGVFFGNSLVRTDGTFQIGASGATLSVTGTALNYRGLLVVDANKTVITTANSQFTGNVDVDGTINVDGASTLIGAVNISGATKVSNVFTVERTENTFSAMYVKQNGTGDIARFGSATDELKFVIGNNGSITSKGALSATGNGAIGGTFGVTGATTLSSTLAVTGATTLGSTLAVEQGIDAKGKLWVGKGAYTGTPLYTITMGDTDTGFNWLSDGVFELRSNTQIVADFSSTAFNVNKVLNAKSNIVVTGYLSTTTNATIGGTLGVTGATTLNGAVTANSTLNVTGTLTASVDIVQKGATLDATYVNVTGDTITGDLNVSGGHILLNNATSNKLIFGNVGVTAPSANIDTDDGTKIILYTSNYGIGVETSSVWYSTHSNHKWYYLSGATRTLGMTLDNTGTLNSVGGFKWNGQSLDDRYVNTTGDTINGNLTITRGVNSPSLVLQGATAGWASGMWFDNTTATTGRKWGLFSSSNGGFYVTQEGGVGATFLFDINGHATINKNLTVTGTLSTSSNLSTTGTLTVTGATTLNGVVNLNNNMIVKDGFAIVPQTANGATLGTPELPFKDVYIGANSLYVDGKKVVSSSADTIDISTDIDQHLSINTSGLGTSRLASAKEVILYSGQLVNLQAGGNMSALSSGLISFKSDANGSGIELVSQSALGNVNITSANRIELSGTNGITFTQRPKVGSTDVQLVTDAIAPSRITFDASNRMITDAERISWNGMLSLSGGTMTGFITLHADPTSAMHPATKQYVDAVKQSLDIKDSVRVATTTNITLSGGQAIDGVVLNVGNRVLVKDQTDAKTNGVYVVQSGAWTRAIDFDTDADVTSGAFVFVEEGTQFANMGFVLVTDGAINIGVTPINFTQFSGAGQVINGTGLSKTGNTLAIANTGVTAGTYRSVTVNAQGQVTSGTNPTTVDGYGITDAIKTSGGTITGSAWDNANGGNFVISNSGTVGASITLKPTSSVLGAKGWSIYSGSTASSIGDGNIGFWMHHDTGYNAMFKVDRSGNGYLGVGATSKIWTAGNDGAGSGLDADLINGISVGQLARVDADRTITANWTFNTPIKATKNTYTVTFATTDTATTKTITHNLGNANYRVTVGANTVKRHVGWLNKTATTVTIEIDDLNLTEDVVVDVIIMPY